MFAWDCRHICPRHRHWRGPINPPVNIDSEPPFCGSSEKSADFIPRPFIFDPSIDREQSGEVAKAAVAQLEICAQLLIAANPKTLKKRVPSFSSCHQRIFSAHWSLFNLRCFLHIFVIKSSPPPPLAGLKRAALLSFFLLPILHLPLSYLPQNLKSRFLFSSLLSSSSASWSSPTLPSSTSRQAPL